MNNDLLKKFYDLLNETPETLNEKKKKPKPTSPDKWARAKAKARSKFDVYPSAYANAYAAKEYKKMGGGWRMGESAVEEGQIYAQGGGYGEAQRWYRPKDNVGEDEQLDELKCWPGYTRVKGVPAGKPGSCKKKTNEDDNIAEAAMKMDEYVRLANALHAQYKQAVRDGNKQEAQRLQQEREELDAKAKKGLLPEEQKTESAIMKGLQFENDKFDETAYQGGLKKWFKEKWVNLAKKKKSGGYEECGTSGDNKGYAKCVPAAKAARMSDKEEKSAINRKRAAQRAAGRPGKKSGGKGQSPVFVKTDKKKTNEGTFTQDNYVFKARNMSGSKSDQELKSLKLKQTSTGDWYINRKVLDSNPKLKQEISKLWIIR